MFNHRLKCVLVCFTLMVSLAAQMGMQCAGNSDNGLPNGDQDQGNPSDVAGIYVTNYYGNSVTVYALDAENDSAPKRTISGDKTGLNGPLGIARDSQRRIYVANREGCTVSVFAPGTANNATPVNILTNPDMGAPEGLAIGNDDGVFVTNCPSLGGCGGEVGVFHFTKDSDTSDYRIAGANTELTVPVGATLDEGRNLYVANAFDGKVAVFAPGQSGNQFPMQSFRPGGNTQSIAYGMNSILLGWGGSGINTYHSNSSGDAAWVGQLPNIGYTGGIYFDTDVTPPIVYVADFSGNKVHIIQTVGVPPFLSIQSIKTIEGPSTGLSAPYGIVVIKV